MVILMHFTDTVLGIGLEGHESPYLTGGTNDIILTGHTFSNEPGIYIEGSVCISIPSRFELSHSFSIDRYSFGGLLLHRRRWQTRLPHGWSGRTS